MCPPTTKDPLLELNNALSIVRRCSEDLVVELGAAREESRKKDGVIQGLESQLSAKLDLEAENKKLQEENEALHDLLEEEGRRAERVEESLRAFRRSLREMAEVPQESRPVEAENKPLVQAPAPVPLPKASKPAESVIDGLPQKCGDWAIGVQVEYGRRFCKLYKEKVELQASVKKTLTDLCVRGPSYPGLSVRTHKRLARFPEGCSIARINRSFRLVFSRENGTLKIHEIGHHTEYYSSEA